MKYYRSLILPIVLLSGLIIIISSVAEAQEETNIRGHITFDFPKTSETEHRD